MKMAVATLMATVLSASGIGLSAPAVADSGANLRTAVMSLRQSACPALKSEPLAEQAAENVLDSTNSWIDHTARAVPVPDALPLLKDLGYPGNKGTLLVSSGDTDAQAIAGLLLQGYKSIPDCSYTDYGASVGQNQSSGYYLAAIVMAGA